MYGTLAGARSRLMEAVRGPFAGIVALALSTLYFTTSATPFNLFIFNTVLLATIGAIALNLLMGTAGLVSIGNAAFLAVGGFGTVFFLRSSIPFPFDVLLAGVVAGLIGLVVGLPALRLHGLTLALTTLAAFFITIFVANEYQSHAEGAGEAGFNFAPAFLQLGFREKEVVWSWLLWGVVALVILLAWAWMRGKTGRAWRLLREHQGVAATLGVPVTRYKLQAFVVSSFLIGIQGGLAAQYTGTVTIENYTLLLSIQFIAMILIGGLDSILGAVLGAALITWLPHLVPDVTALFVDQQTAALKGPQVSVIIYGLLIVLFITRSPDGIVGWLRSVRNSSWFQRLLHLRPRVAHGAGPVLPPPEDEVAGIEPEDEDKEGPALTDSARQGPRTGAPAGDLTPIVPGRHEGGSSTASFD